MDISSILDSFEKQVEEQKKEVEKRTEKTVLYGEWVDFDLQDVIEEREKWKRQLIQQGMLENEKSFSIKGKTVKYSSNYVNRALLHNCIENYKAMQCRCFEKYYISEITMFSGCVIYMKKLMRNIAAENIRFIKIVLSELDLTWNSDLDSEYLSYIDFDEVENYLNNLGDMISQKMVDVASERFEKRRSGNIPEVWIGGEGIGGLIKGYVLGTAVNFGVEKISDAIHKAGDSMAVSKLQRKFTEMFAEIQKHLFILVTLSADLILPFLLNIFQRGNIYYWFDVNEDNRWKQMLDFTNYEYEHDLVDHKTYWERLIYLLGEYPFVKEIYNEILSYNLIYGDLDCLKELYRVAVFFGMGCEVLQIADRCMSELAVRYKNTSITDLNEREVYEAWDKYEEGMYELDDCAVKYNDQMENLLNHYNMYKYNLYRLIIVNRTFFLKKKEKDEIQDSVEYTEEFAEKLWERVGKSKGIYHIDASVEQKLWKYYTYLVSDVIDKKQIVQFENNLQGLMTHFNDADTYKANCAKCIYTDLLLEWYDRLDIDSKESIALIKDMKKDIYLAADNGIIIAKYLFARFTEDMGKKERFLLEAVQNNISVETELKVFYLERSEKSAWAEACAERWQMVEKYVIKK